MPGAVGAAAGLAGRGMSAMEGARYGGRLSDDIGLGPWPGRVAGGVGGALLPEAIGKMSNPILRGIAGMLGKSAPEAAAGAAGAAEAAAPEAAAGAEDVNAAYRRAGLHTPYTSAQETGTWHAGQGAIASPYESEVQSLTQKMQAARPTRPTTFSGMEMPAEAPPQSLAQKVAAPEEAPTFNKRFTDKPISQYRGAGGNPQSDALADSMIRSGMDRNTAMARAEQIADIHANPGKYTSYERQVADNTYNRFTSKVPLVERRGQ
jgi:hypothetical protein